MSLCKCVARKGVAYHHWDPLPQMGSEVSLCGVNCSRSLSRFTGCIAVAAKGRGGRCESNTRSPVLRCKDRIAELLVARWRVIKLVVTT